MIAVVIASVPMTPVVTGTYVPAPTSAFSASASACTAVPLFSISRRPNTSASISASAATILSCWRWNSSAVSAPRW